ncbi:MAG: hypothetical protein ACE1Z7_05980 [Woeseiaceae bacterium]
MMETVFLFCTDASAGPDGKLNIHGVFNDLRAPDFPARQDQMVLAGIVEWDRHEQGRIPFRIDLIDPEGMSIFTIEGHTDVEPQPQSGAPARTQFVLPLKNVMFPVPGRYQIRMDFDGHKTTGPSMYLLRSSDEQEERS